MAGDTLLGSDTGLPWSLRVVPPQPWPRSAVTPCAWRDSRAPRPVTSRLARASPSARRRVEEIGKASSCPGTCARDPGRTGKAGARGEAVGLGAGAGWTSATTGCCVTRWSGVRRSSRAGRRSSSSRCQVGPVSVR